MTPFNIQMDKMTLLDYFPDYITYILYSFVLYNAYLLMIQPNFHIKRKTLMFFQIKTNHSSHSFPYCSVVECWPHTPEVVGLSLSCVNVFFTY